MKRIAIILILSVIVFVGTILASIMYISRKSLDAADYINAIALDDFQNELYSDALMTEIAARNFLTGIPSARIGSDSTSIVIEESELNTFREMIPEVLPQFLKINRYYLGSMLVIDRDVCRKYFNSDDIIVPSVMQGEDTVRDLSGQFDFMGSEKYLQLKRDRKILWTSPEPSTPEEYRILMLNIPLSMKNGQFFGVFSLSLDVSVLNEKIRKHLPYGEGNSAVFIADGNDYIFSSCPEWLMEPACQDSIRNSTGILKKHDNGEGYYIHHFDGQVFYVYQRDLPSLHWRIFTVNNTKAIYHDAMHVVRTMILSSITGMLLMLICCTAVFSQTRKNLHQKVAAEEELRMAAKVQTSMLKKSSYATDDQSLKLTFDAVLLPAKEAGGDLYDYVGKEGKLLFCIGDVSGKGMPAALYMTQIVSLFRNAVRYTSEPSEIVSQINDVLSDNPQMAFCTLFVGVISGEELTFCNAGHNPPVLLTSRPSYLKMKPNLAVGVLGGYPYQSERITFRPGDKLVLYTDGITEAKCRGPQRYGDERLLELLDSISMDKDSGLGKAINTAIIESVKRFAQGTEQSDDITIVSIMTAPAEDGREVLLSEPLQREFIDL